MRNILRSISIFCFLICISSLKAQERSIPSEKSQLLSDENKIKLYIKMADSLFRIGKNNQAEVLYEIAYKKVKKTNNDSLTAVVGNNYAYFLYDINNIPRALKMNQQIKEFCKKNGDKVGLIDASLLNAYILGYHQEKELKALQIYSEAINLIDEKVPKKLIISSYDRRGNLLLRMNQHIEAREDFHRALAYAQNDENLKERRLRLYLSLSTSFEKENEKGVDSSNYYISRVIEYCNTDDDLFSTCIGAYNNLAYNYVLQKKPEQAKTLLEENISAEDISKIKVVNPYGYSAMMHTYGKMYLDLGDYEKAIEKFEVAKKHALQRRYLTSALIVLQDLSLAYEKSGNLMSSLETTRMIKPLMDTLDLQKIQREVAKLESQRKLKETEEELIALNKEKETVTLRMSKAQFTSYLLGILLIIGIFIFINRISVNKVKFHKLNEKVNHNRLLSLQSAMNPHFLFNSFGTLQHFILKKEIKKANSYMTTLSDLIRNVFASSNSIYIHFNNEINILKSYIELELGRFDHNFEAVFEIPPQLVSDNSLIPSMILQPYVENAIIHGFSEKKGDKKLTIEFDKINSKTIQCQITDNGIGRKKVAKIQRKSKIKKNLSIATKNTQERLKIINKKDEQEGNIIIQDLYDADGKTNGTKVIISLPIITNRTK